jgi:hypothetical protein
MIPESVPNGPDCVCLHLRRGKHYGESTFDLSCAKSTYKRTFSRQMVATSNLAAAVLSRFCWLLWCHALVLEDARVTNSTLVLAN